jgi:hypothetical protein
MKLLVNGQRRCATIKCFAASGNRFPSVPRSTKKGCGDAAALLLEGLSLICADRFASCGLPTRQNCRPSFRRPSRNRQEPKRRGQENVPIFPGAVRVSQRHSCERPRAIASFSRKFGWFRTEYHAGPLCRRMVSARSKHCPATRRDPIRPAGPAASWSSRFGAGPGHQLIPISTAILIRSEWFLAPSFCFSRDVVLATVL